MTDTIVVPARYCGPDGSGNGGYVAGLLAREVVGDAEFTLRVPPPLDADCDKSNGVVCQEFVSAALDCAGGWSLELGPGQPLLLGRYVVRIDKRVQAGETHVVVGWPLAVEGRKL